MLARHWLADQNLLLLTVSGQGKEIPNIPYEQGGLGFQSISAEKPHRRKVLGIMERDGCSRRAMLKSEKARDARSG